MSRLAQTMLVLTMLACTPPEYPLCRTDDHCRPAESCRNSKCVQCTTDGECMPGSSCTDGMCQVILDGCSGNSDCAKGQVCLFELCSGCFDEGQCDVGLRCVDGACVGCAKDSDCDGSLACVDGSCSEPDEDVPEMVIGPDGCVIEPVYFEFDSAELTDEAKKSLDTTAGCLSKSSTTVVVGYTDPVGDHFYNLDLGLRRAEAVASYLTKKGLNANLLVATTVGDKGAGKDEKKARRVEFL